ncbi:MAG: hypothetical protein J5685_02650 [Clostridiales bacterium]|nr:hypothetical protein [Clostridiales bacterium]
MKKILSTIICLGMVFPLVSCALFDRDDKAVLEAAKEYAEAVVNCDLSDLSDIMEDGDDAAEQISGYMSGYTELPPREVMCGVISDSLCYGIDEGTVVSSKRSGTASVDVTFAMTDYISLFDELVENDGSDDEYIDMLSDAPSDYFITQTVDLVLIDGQWLVADENCEGLYEVYAYYSFLDQAHFPRENDVSVISGEFFLDAFHDALGFDDSRGTWGGDDRNFTFWFDGDGYYITYNIYDRDEYGRDHAADLFEDEVDMYDDNFVDGFRGDHCSGLNVDAGYIIFDGLSENTGNYMYGGIYYAGNTLAYIVAYDNDPARNAAVEDLLQRLQYPSPETMF